MPNSNSITIYVANLGTSVDGGTDHSLTGHIWVGITRNGVTTYYGFGPAVEGTTGGAGVISNEDHLHYDTWQYSRTIALTDEQYDDMLDYYNPTTTPFNDDLYDGLTNNCLDYVWGGLNIGGLNPNGIDHDVWPGNNPNDLDRLSNPALGIPPVDILPYLPDNLAPLLGIGPQGGGIIFPQIGDGSPLVLDLDGDGIEVTKLGFGEGASSVYWSTPISESRI